MLINEQILLALEEAHARNPQHAFGFIDFGNPDLSTASGEVNQPEIVRVVAQLKRTDPILFKDESELLPLTVSSEATTELSSEPNKSDVVVEAVS